MFKLIVAERYEHGIPIPFGLRQPCIRGVLDIDDIAKFLLFCPYCLICRNPKKGDFACYPGLQASVVQIRPFDHLVSQHVRLLWMGLLPSNCWGPFACSFHHVAQGAFCGWPSKARPFSQQTSNGGGEEGLGRGDPDREGVCCLTRGLRGRWTQLFRGFAQARSGEATAGAQLPSDRARMWRAFGISAGFEGVGASHRMVDANAVPSKSPYWIQAGSGK